MITVVTKGFEGRVLRSTNIAGEKVALWYASIPYREVATLSYTDSEIGFFDGNVWLLPRYIPQAHFDSVENVLTEIESAFPQVQTTVDIETGAVEFTLQNPNQRLVISPKLARILGMITTTIFDGDHSVQISNINAGSQYAFICTDCIGPAQRVGKYDLQCIGIYSLVTNTYSTPPYYVETRGGYMDSVAIHLLGENAMPLPISQNAVSVFQLNFQEGTSP